MNSVNTDELDTDPLRHKQRNNRSCLVTALVLGLGGVILIGLLVAIAIPAFTQYVKRTKASEAERVIAALQHSALQYYQDSGTDGACHFPPSANPVPAGEPCCEQVGPTGGERWTPAAKTWEQPGWKALSFSQPEGTYFAYQTINKEPQEGSDTLEIRAFADFNPGGPAHTYSITLEGKRNDQGECVANALAPVITNEFE